MSTDSVKFLNEKCLLQVNVAVSEKLFEGDEECRRGLVDEIRHRQARMLGESILADRATRTEVHDTQRMERVYRAEVYALSLADVKRLYDLIRAEERKPLCAFIEGVRANGSPDAVDAANELSKRLEGGS